LAREHLTKEKRCEMYENNLKHYETLQNDYLELKHRNECYSRQIAHVHQLETELIGKQLENEQLDKDRNDLQKQLKQLNDYIANEEKTSRQLKNDYFLLKQRYNDEQWNELTMKLNDATMMTRQMQITLKTTNDDNERLKAILEQNEITIMKLSRDYKLECQVREEWQSKCLHHLSTRQETNDNDEQRFDIVTVFLDCYLDKSNSSIDYLSRKQQQTMNTEQRLVGTIDVVIRRRIRWVIDVSL
jgi:DNA gyrase/topoisomerase IV subunit A